MDNPTGLANMIINVFLNEGREVLQPQDTEEDYLDNFMSEVEVMAED